MIESITSVFGVWMESDAVLVGALASWLITFLLGEAGGIFALTYALNGALDVPVTLVFVFLGSLSADMFWYAVTVSTLRPQIERRFRKKSTSEQRSFLRSILRYADTHPYTILLLIKFLLGMRLILTIFIATRRDIPFQKYLVCNIIANILFVTTLYGIAVLLHASVGDMLDLRNNIFHIVALVIIIAAGSQALFRIGERFIVRLLSNGNK